MAIRVKHDCSKVMELWVEGKTFRNGLGDVLQLEMDYLYPMLKTSEIANGSTGNPTRWMLVTQKFTGDDTATIEAKAPKNLELFASPRQALLDGRRSSIYRKRCRFSVFGVGDYAFASWKVAISGFYKKLAFAVIGPYGGKSLSFWMMPRIFFPARMRNRHGSFIRFLAVMLPKISTRPLSFGTLSVRLRSMSCDNWILPLLPGSPELQTNWPMPPVRTLSRIFPDSALISG